jgi:hypothetical protein
MVRTGKSQRLFGREDFYLSETGPGRQYFPSEIPTVSFLTEKCRKYTIALGMDWV